MICSSARASPWVDLSRAAGIQDESLFTGYALDAALGPLQNLALNVVAGVRARALAGEVRSGPGEPDLSDGSSGRRRIERNTGRVSPDRCPLWDRRSPDNGGRQAIKRPGRPFDKHSRRATSQTPWLSEKERVLARLRTCGLFV